MTDIGRLEALAESLDSEGLVAEAECVRDAIMEIRSAREAAMCPSCHGHGHRFYAGYGTDTCRKCGGSGRS